MNLPAWIDAAAPKNSETLAATLTEALVLVARLRGHLGFAAAVKKEGVVDMFGLLSPAVWWTSDWTPEAVAFWGRFPLAQVDEVLTDAIDTVLMSVPLGDLEDEEEAEAYWPDIVATVRGVWQRSPGVC